MDFEGLPEYMTRFKGKTRDDSETRPLDELDICCRPENYGRLRVGIDSGSLYVIDVEAERYVEFDYASMGNVAEVIGRIEQDYTLEEAINEVHNDPRPSDNFASRRLEDLVEDQDVGDEFYSSLVDIKDDWMPSAKDRIKEELREDVPVWKSEENHDFRKIKKLVQNTYGLSLNSATKQMKDAGVDWH